MIKNSNTDSVEIPAPLTSFVPIVSVQAGKGGMD
jgi:hypothetical protein